jgi:carbamoyl-phosphate synthase large subunit
LPKDIDKLIKQEGFPLIIKPRIGDSSKDTYIVKDKKELEERISFLLNKKFDNNYLSKNIGPIIQKYLVNEKEEYTSTTLTFDKKCYGILTMKREMKFGGHTTKAIVEDFFELNKKIKKVAEVLNAFGPANFQSRLFDDTPLIFEINCRFSGTTPFCSEIGFNTVEAAIRKIILGEKIKKLSYKKGVILRYFNEVFIPSREIEKISKFGFIKNSKSKVNEIF